MCKHFQSVCIIRLLVPIFPAAFPLPLLLPGLPLRSLRVVVVLWRREANYSDWASPKRHSRWMDELCRGGGVGGRGGLGWGGGWWLVVRVLALMLTRSKVCMCPSVAPAPDVGEMGDRREQSWAAISRVAPCHSASHNPTRELARCPNTEPA